MRFLRYIVAVVALCTVQMAVAQSEPPTITSHISADSIRIGDRVMLTIEVEKDVMQQIVFPTFNFSKEGEDAGLESVEVVNDFEVDTLATEGRRERLRKRYEMAIFDEGIYNMGKAQVLYLDKNIVDTLFGAKEEQVVVLTMPIDTTMTTVRELKPQKRLKWHPAEHIGYIGIGLGVLSLLALAVYLLARYLGKRGKSIADLFKPAPLPPAHIVALDALERLHNEKLWQNNKHKQYYSALSDILRTYLDGRFEVGAMEMTTDEIVAALREVEIEQKQKMELLSVLRDADLVKFAKMIPEAEENESAYHRAFYFVENTKPVEPTLDEEERTTNDKEEQQ